MQSPMTLFSVQEGAFLRVLLIDDQSLTEFLLRKMVGKENNIQLYYCEKPEEAIMMAEGLLPSVILLDMYMGPVDGMTLLHQFRQHELLAEVPIIMLSVEENASMKAAAFAGGANDYLIKLPEREEMLARLTFHADSYHNLLHRRRSEEKFRQLFEHSHDAIFLTETINGIIKDCNSAAIRLLEMEKKNILGSSFHKIFTKECRTSFQPTDQDITTDSYPNEATIVRANMERISVAVSHSCFSQDGCLFTQWMLRDISERKQLLSSLEEILQVAESANRAKSDFLATMSHEIRTPMNVMIGRAELLLETELTPLQQEHVGVINRAGATLLSLINDILDISKIESGSLELEEKEFLLTALMIEIQEIFIESARKKGLTLELEIQSGIPDRVIGDATRLGQIMFNLVSNAIKFTKQGGIEMKLKQANRRGEEGRVLFLVKDTGIGIAREKQEMIFNPFSQADSSITREFGGTGLGLSICNRLVEMMGGQMRVNSELGRGSTFYFTLSLETPFSAGVAHIAPNKSPEVIELALSANHLRAQFRSMNILIVDDSEDNRLLFQAFLKTSGHYLYLGEDGHQALNLFKSNKFDLIFMDLQMPGKDGLQATREIRQWEAEHNIPATPIFALTAHATPEDTEKCLEAGFNKHLTKPIRKQKLLEAIQSVMDMNKLSDS
ncbi:MAG: response regulator [Magnetococcus sp. DMHC-6]